ncbi:MAG TPA: MFS transporter [Aggregatilinea sp.]|jgi:MFS family permease|uniref:MFS transporter n=1 Tax=Aggregatilinea sp. TaxID=2806333 RepID=UPI002BC7DAA4|nr:MFS transporter [Aggregatilinea sp.]HML20681.1 MFS transporter [Aggregatilinea sp.]
MTTDSQSSDPLSGSASSAKLVPRRLTQGFRALHNYNFRLFWWSQIVSLSGTWMQTTAQSWLVLQITGSGLSLGLVTAVQFLPVTLLALYGGVLADRLRKQRAILFTQAASMIQAFIFGGLVATDHIALWHIYVLAAIQGIITAVDNPTRQAFVVEMVGRDDLPNALALNSTAFNAARIVGPSIAGIIIDQVGIALTLIINAVTFIPVLIALLRMDTLALHTPPPPRKGNPTKQVMEGLAYAWRTPAILTIFIAVAVIGTFGYNFSVTLPLLADFVLHKTAAGLGTLMSFLGIGSLIAAMATAYAKTVSLKRLLWGAFGFSVLFAMVALSRVYVLSLGLLAVMGFCGIIFAITSNTLLQLLAPDELRGRLMSVHVLLFVGSTPLGGFLIGLFSDLFGVSTALFICALICIAGVLAATVYVRSHGALDTQR